MIRTILKKMLSLMLIVGMSLITLASCSKQKTEIVSVTLLRSTVKTTYTVGEEIDFKSIKIEVTYSDPSLNTIYTYSQITVDAAKDITATPGEKTVKISFTDSHTNQKQHIDVKITVKEAESPGHE